MSLARRPLAAVTAAALLAAGLVASGAAPVLAETAKAAPAAADAAAAVLDDGITVGGLGTVNGTPDLLRLQVRVVAVKPTAALALAAASGVSGRVRTALRQHGVAATDIQTTQLNVTPAYAGRPARQVGFQVVEGLQAQLTLAGAGSTITDVVRVGGTALRFDGVFFLISDESPLQAQARDKAFAQARAKAEQYARLAGRTLGAVESVNEDIVPGYYDGGYGRFVGGAAFAAGGYAISPGVQRIDVRVIARWALA